MIFCTLNKYMKEYKVTQTKIAETTGITRPTLLQLIKNENHSIKYEVIEKLCSFFSIEMGELLIHTNCDIEYRSSRLDIDEDLIQQTDGEVERITITTIVSVDNYDLEFVGEYIYSTLGLEVNFQPKFISMNCVLDSDEYNYIVKKLLDNKTLNIFIDTFNIKDIIVADLELNETVIDMMKFKFVKEDKADLNKVSALIEDLEEEDLSYLYDKHFQGYKSSKEG